MAELRAVLWDFDGTLMDTEPIWDQTMRELAQDWDIELSQDYHRDVVGTALPVTAAYMIERQRRPRYSNADWQHEIMQRMMLRYTIGPIVWRPGAQQLVAQLQQRGIAQAVVSGTQRALLLSFLKRLDNLPLEFIIAGDEVAQPKPHPEAYLLAAKRLAVAIDECLVVEDSVSGAQAGNAAGAVVLAVPSVQSPLAAPRREVRDTLEGLDVEDLISIFEQGALQ